MSQPSRIVEVAPDHYEVVAEDVLLVAQLDSTLAVCIHDAVEDCGALLHLRFVARGDDRADVTDSTLASDLILLDRCVERLRSLAPRAQDLQGRIATHVQPDSVSQRIAAAVLMLTRDFLTDSGIRIVSDSIDYAAPRSVRFRPLLGRLEVDARSRTRLAQAR